MLHEQELYRIAPDSTPVLSHGHARLREQQWILHDFDDDAREEYLRAAYEIFLHRLETLKSPKRALTEEEETELRFMLDALIAAKQL